MSTSKACLTIAILFSVNAMAAEPPLPRLGEPVSDETVEAVDYVVMPDGAGLPDGSGNARRGAEVYAQHCLACHGEAGANGINDQLAGGHGSIDTDQPVKTVGSYWPYATTVFDYIRRAMPYQDPGSLSNDDIYSLTAYVLFINDIVADDQRIDAESLPLVKMPNRDNFVWAYTPRLLAD